MYKNRKRQNKFKKTVVILLIIIGADLIFSACGKSQEVYLSEETFESQQEYTDNNNMIYVYLSGEVESPGVYEVSADSRLYQVIDIAGGMTKDAKKDYLNLAETVCDGQQIHVLSKQEYKKNQNSDSAHNTDSGSSTLININTATVEELQQLSGIGETKALEIINYRQKNGNFSSIEDIKNVSGIGDSTFEKIKSQITTN